MSYIFISVTVGVIAGLLSLVLLNWLLYNYMAPKIKFTHNIYKYKDDSEPSGYSYMVGIRNVRNRDAVDLKIRCAIWILDFPKKGLKQIVDVGLSSQNILEITPKTNRNTRLLFNGDKLIKRILESEFSVELEECAHSRRVMPEYFLKRFGDAYIRVDVYLTDVYSGFRDYIVQKDMH